MTERESATPHSQFGKSDLLISQCMSRSLSSLPPFNLSGSQCLLHAFYRFLRQLRRIERRQTDIAFPARTEAGARRADDFRLIQQEIKEIPARHTFRHCQPYIWTVHAAAGRKTRFLRTNQDDRSILSIDIQRFLDLLLAFFGIDRFCTALHDIRAAIELRALAAIPQLVCRDLLALLRF